MSQPTHPAPPRITVIDDEEDVLTFIRVALEDAGFVVQTLDRPTEAMEAFASFRPQVILLDLLMPERIGLSLYEEIRKNPLLRNTPVIFVSGLAAGDSLVELSAVSGAGPPPLYLEKPVSAVALLDAVRRALAEAGEPTP